MAMAMDATALSIVVGKFAGRLNESSCCVRATGGARAHSFRQQSSSSSFKRSRSTRLVPLREEGDWQWQQAEVDDQARAEEDPSLLRFFATCSPGLEPVVAAELSAPSVGAVNVHTGSAGVSFQGTWLTGFRANLWLRCAVRVLQEIASGELPQNSRNDSVYEFTKNAVEWQSFFLTSAGSKAFRSFAVQSRVWDCSWVSNSQVASTRAKDAICDSLRDSCQGRRPDPPEPGTVADVPLFLSLYRDRAALYRDMSGTSLHMRGYREIMHRASLNEGIAAAMLTLAGWNSRVPGFGSLNKNTIWEADGSSGGGPVLLDPMCGSGTILIEAALMACNSAPGLMRDRWPFMTWHDFDRQAWADCVTEASTAAVEAPSGLRLLGNDIHEGAILLCTRDAEKAGVRQLIELSNEDCRRYVPAAVPSLVIVNPPWGNRLEEEEARIIVTWMGLGRFLKQYCSKTDVYVLSGNSALTRQLQMKADRKWPFTVGGLDCRLLHYYVLPPKAQQTKHEETSAEQVAAG